MQDFMEGVKKQFKNISSCCGTQILVDKCPKHKSENVKFMCTHPKCHQILCSMCISEHKRLHKANNLREMPLSLLSDISRIYTKDNLKSQLQEIKVRKQQNYQKPQQVITNCIQGLLYGTSERRERQLQSSLEQMKGGYNTNLLIKMVQDDNEYSLKNNNYKEFKTKYFNFLDNLIQDLLLSDKYE